MRRALQQAGAEPDESWCLDEEKEFPDLVLEIALTSGGVNKLELYRRFQVPEVWFWREGRLRVFVLRPDGSAYQEVSRSRLLPKLDITLLDRCASIRSWQQARRQFRAGLKAS
jgi:Uma2 family endonuclease